MNTSIKWHRVRKQIVCPVCGKPDWCLISEDGKSAVCARIESDQPVGSKGAGWLHRLDAAKSLLVLQRPKPGVKQTPKAAPGVLDRTYRVLLTELQLSETHRENLHCRGLSDAEIEGLRYRSLPANGRHELIIRLVGKLAGVPGFYFEAGEWRLAGPAGIAIPVRDTGGRIVGLQIRCDSADNRGSYRWLSSRGYFVGCSPGAPVHVAGPVSMGGDIWITEGPLKADIAALKLVRTVLAVPGVSNWHGVVPICHQLRPDRVIVSFDMDKNQNPAVRLHLDALIAYLIRGSVRVFEADWNPNFKGLDDLLTGGQL